MDFQYLSAVHFTRLVAKFSGLLVSLFVILVKESLTLDEPSRSVC